MNTHPPHARAGHILAVACLQLSTACASFEAPARYSLIDSRLHVVPVLAARTSIETNSEPAASDNDNNNRSGKRVTATHAVLWTGVALASLGGAGLLGFGATSLATDRKLSRGYEEDGLTHDEQDTLIKRGEAMNTATIVSASVGLLGALIAVTAYGVEYTKCGRLAPKRRRCDER
ncbi:MAG TPA: hypothetical protein ENJ18_04990 [Nannocystis exedens]|nr:hypothetical protein [Nannocystis exedens]